MSPCPARARQSSRSARPTAQQHTHEKHNNAHHKPARGRRFENTQSAHRLTMIQQMSRSEPSRTAREGHAEAVGVHGRPLNRELTKIRGPERPLPLKLRRRVVLAALALFGLAALFVVCAHGSALAVDRPTLPPCRTTARIARHCPRAVSATTFSIAVCCLPLTLTVAVLTCTPRDAI